MGESNLAPRQHAPVQRRTTYLVSDGIRPSSCSVGQWLKCAGTIAACIATGVTGVGLVACVAAAASECVDCI